MNGYHWFRGQVLGKCMGRVGIKGAAKLSRVSLGRSKYERVNHRLTVITFQETSGMFKSTKMILFRTYYERIPFLNA